MASEPGCHWAGGGGRLVLASLPSPPSSQLLSGVGQRPCQRLLPSRAAEAFGPLTTFTYRDCPGSQKMCLCLLPPHPLLGLDALLA